MSEESSQPPINPPPSSDPNSNPSNPPAQDPSQQPLSPSAPYQATYQAYPTPPTQAQYPPQQGGYTPTMPGMGMQGVPGGVAGQQVRRPHLYVGNLSPRVTEYILTQIFAVAGPVTSAKIIPDRNFTHGGLNYGFVEYSTLPAAETALSTLNGRKIFDTEIRVNWAYQGTQTAVPLPGSIGPGGVKEDTQHHFHVFVGDLSAEVNDEVLAKAFSAFGSLSEARVMWDMNSGKSRGYGFLAFREKADAEQAISTMNGEWLGSRAIRVNWANQKTQTGGSRPGGGGPSSSSGGYGTPTGFGSASGGMGGGSGGVGDYSSVVAQTPPSNTTVYVGNLIPYSTQADLIPLFQGYGYIVEIRMQADRGFAFVKLDTHENAAAAIVNLQNHLVHGRPIKCSWGKDREGGSGGAGAGGQAAAGGAGVGMGAAQPGMGMGGFGRGVVPGYNPMMQQQMYGIPQAQYPQYAGYPAYGMTAGTPTNPQQDPNAAAAAAAAYYQQQAAAGGNQWGAYYGGQPPQAGQGQQ